MCTCTCRSNSVDECPVYEIPPVKYAAETVIRILLNPNLEDLKICKQRPLHIITSSTYVIDLNYLKDQDDVKRDNFGIWHHSGSHNLSFECCITTDGEVRMRCDAANGGQWKKYSLRRLHSKHSTNHNFKRLICFLTGNY